MIAKRFTDYGFAQKVCFIGLAAFLIVLAGIMARGKQSCEPVRYVCHGALTYDNGVAICKPKSAKGE